MRPLSSARYLLAIFLVLSCVVVRADKVDDLVAAEMQKQKIPGVAVAVVKEGKIVKAKGYGLANVETNTLATAESVFKIASVSKQFIAAGIMLLAQDGKLSVNDRVSKYQEGTPDAWSEITIRHLLTHTSGIVREAPGFDPLRVQPDLDVIKTAYQMPLRFKPGEKWEYCNVGYFALAEIIHKASGKTWPDFMHDRLFAPLGMTSTRATTTTDLVPNRASGYALSSGGLRNAPEYLALRPSGAFLSTVLDLAKWDAALYTDKPLPSAVKNEMWTPVTLAGGKTHPYGYGWSVDNVHGHRRVWHNGSLTGFRSCFERYVDDKLTVIVLTNLSSANPETIGRGVAAIFVPELAAKSAAGGASSAARAAAQTKQTARRTR